MARWTGLALLLFMLPATHADERSFDVDVGYDPTGIWHSEKEDLVVRRTGRTSWMGYPTEGRGVTSGRTWHFQALGGTRLRFWISLEGKATTQKLHEQDLDFGDTPDKLTLEVSGKRGRPLKLEFQRVIAKIPEKVDDVVVSFVPSGKGRYNPDQDVDIRLVRALTRAIGAAHRADPHLTRVNISVTIDRNVGLSKKHSRLIRQALVIDRLNGAGAEHWVEDVKEKLLAIKEGKTPPVDTRREYAHHATALVLALLMQEEVDEVVCPAVLDNRTIPYVEWWFKHHGRNFPRGSPSIVGFRKKIDAMLEKSRGSRRKMPGLLFVSVRRWEAPICRHRKCRDGRYDRE